jgi:hypothetical protein
MYCSSWYSSSLQALLWPTDFLEGAVMTLRSVAAVVCAGFLVTCQMLAQVQGTWFTTSGKLVQVLVVRSYNSLSPVTDVAVQLAEVHPPVTSTLPFCSNVAVPSTGKWSPSYEN